MLIPTWRKWFAPPPSAAPKARARLRVGIPRVLNIWSTHQFWVSFLHYLGIAADHIVFSGDTAEDQGREYGRGHSTSIAAIR